MGSGAAIKVSIGGKGVGPPSLAQAGVFCAIIGLWAIGALFCVRAYERQPPDNEALRAWRRIFMAVFFINGAKERAPAGAMALLQQLGMGVRR